MFNDAGNFLSLIRYRIHSQYQVKGIGVIGKRGRNHIFTFVRKHFSGNFMNVFRRNSVSAVRFVKVVPFGVNNEVSVGVAPFKIRKPVPVVVYAVKKPVSGGPFRKP